MKQYAGRLEIMLSLKTDGKPDDTVEKLLDLFATIDTDHLNLTWDDCEWQLTEIDSEFGECDTCGGEYELSSRDGRCGDCGECAKHCDHECDHAYSTDGENGICMFCGADQIGDDNE